MIELFAKWASDYCNCVTENHEPRLQDNPIKNSHVTDVTEITVKKLEPCAEGPGSKNLGAERHRIKNAVTAVTAVTSQKSLENSCNRAEGPVVLRLQSMPCLSPVECEEVATWPAPTQRVFTALLEHFEKQGYVLLQAEPLAWAAVRLLVERHGGPVGFKSEITPSGAGSRAMPAEVAPLVDMAKSVFGPDIQVRWEARCPASS